MASTEDSTPAGEAAQSGVEGLEQPADTWTGFIKRHLGPSLLWALLGIGTSHIVLSPTLAANFGLVAIWMLGLIFIVKYGAWELGIKYFFATGENVLDGYAEAPGPKNWLVWYGLVAVAMAVIVNTAAVGMSTAAIAISVFPMDIVSMYTIVVVVSALLILVTDYTLLERFMLSFVAILAVTTLLALFFGPPSAELVSETLFAMPALDNPVFLGLFASAAGLAPTGLGTVFMLGSWSITKNKGLEHLRKGRIDMDEKESITYMQKWLAVGMRDWKIGYGFSFVVIAAMALLAANALYPNPPQNQGMAAALGELLGSAFGPWGAGLMLLGAFAAFWSSVITALDGGARVVTRALELNLERDLDHKRWERILIVLFVLASAIPVLIVGGLPVTLVVMLGTVLIIMEAFIYPANFYIVRRDLPEEFQAGSVKTVYYVLGILFMLLFGIMGAANQAGVIG